MHSNRNALTAWKLILWLIVLASAWTLANLSWAQDVYRNPQNENPANNLQSLIDFAGWSLSERTGMRIEYAGTTSQHCVPGAITFRSYTMAEWIDNKLPLNANAVRGLCTGGGYVIVINPVFAVSRGTVIHDLSHALGAGHLSDTRAVMYGCEGACAITTGALLTTSDVTHIVSNAEWPLYSAPSLCHVEMADDFDLMIPSVGGKRALLNYIGIVGGYQTWAPVYTTDTAQSCANNTLHANGTVTLGDIRGTTTSYSSANLEPYNGNWRLTGVTP